MGGDISVETYMKGNPDRDFLAFAEAGCTLAFQRMVDRHLSSVHGAAARVLGERRDLADDVSQLVFIQLARKGPSLPRTIVVGAWLHRQTVRQALNTVRKESRRQRREQTAFEMQTNESSSDEVSWKAAMPHIDRAILELSEMDQSALALRFSERRGMKEIGERLGLSAGAVEKRIARALEKLRGRLSRRGVTLSAAALGGFLTSRFAEAAPSVLAAAITKEATVIINAAGPQFLTSYATMTAYKTCLVGIVGGFIAGGAFVTLKSDARETSGKTERVSRASGDLEEGSRSGGKRTRFLVPVPGDSVEEIFEQVQELLAMPDNEISRQRLKGLLSAMPSEDFPPLLVLLKKSDFKSWEFLRLLPEVAKAWAAVDPLGAIEGLAATEGDWRKNWNPLQLATEALGVWCQQSPEGAQEWLFQNQENEKYRKAIPEMVGVVAQELRQREGDLAVIDWAHKMVGEKVQKAALASVWSEYTKGDPGKDRSEELAELVKLVTGLDDEEFSTKVFRQLTTDWARMRSREFYAWLDQQSPGPLSYEASLSLMRTPTRNFGVQQEIKNAEIVLSKAGNRDQSEVVSEVIQASDQIPKEMAAWAIPKMKGADLDAAIEQAIKRTNEASASLMGYPPPRIALDWARHHGDPVKRDELIEESYRRWFNYSRDNKGAAGFPEENDWPDELNAVLRRVKEERK